MMTRVRHLMQHHVIRPETETLIIGTFNPDTKDNVADFFYGRQRNSMWVLLPTAYGLGSLKEKSKNEKLSFIKEKQIDFIDLISEVEVEEGEEANYDDAYIDKRVAEWKDVIGEINKLPSLKKVCFTRKTLADVPEMKKRIEEIEMHCKKNKIYFQYLKTPARTYSEVKQKIWSEFFQL